MPEIELRIGTRRSRLARWQAEWVAEGLSRESGAASRFEYIDTEGDRVRDIPLSEAPGESFFTKEIEEALLDHRVDLAVHSLKDVPTKLPSGLHLSVVLRRADVHDVLVSRDGRSLDELPRGATVGTSSVRRIAFLRSRRPDLDVVSLRGNVPTRFEAVTSGRLDAIVLARAGLERLQMLDGRCWTMPAETMPPAVGQGAVAVEIRDGDAQVADALEPLDHAPTHACVRAERKVLADLGAGCQAPLGALAVPQGDHVRLRAAVCSLDGGTIVHAEEIGPSSDPIGLGAAVARSLLAGGAQRLVDEARARFEVGLDAEAAGP